MNIYSSFGVFQGAEHHYFFDVIVVASIPKMFDGFFYRGLGQDRIGFIIDDGPHKASVNVETWHVLDLDAVVLI